MSPPPGKLILVSTPIGNLEDMTFRGVETLKTAAAILAEDTRQTRKLLNRYGVQNELISYHDHNKERVTPRLIERLKRGDVLALVSDAGTPGISDPGFYLTRAAIAGGVPISVVPGASAILSALLMSGFPTDRFVFEGFLGRKRSEIQRQLAALEDEHRTTVFFASPHRLVKTLEVAAEVFGDRPLAVVREITKIHEEVRRGTAAEVLTYYAARRVRGEIVLVIRGAAKSP